MTTTRRFALLTYVVAGTVVILDQLTKAWIAAVLGAGQPPITIVPGVLELIYRLNTGMAFSLLLDAPSLLTVVAAAASVALIVVTWRLRQPGWWTNLALALLLGGAVGNLIDRLRIGAVIDFVYFRPINFPAFNVADSALTVGVILAAWVMWRSSGDQATTVRPPRPTGSDGAPQPEEP